MDEQRIQWAASQFKQGIEYYEARGNREENLELAIAAFQNALEVRTKEAVPTDFL